MEGYNIFYVESTIKFGGVVMYIKTELEASYCYEKNNLTPANLGRTYEKFSGMFHNCIGRGTPYVEPVP